MKKYFFILIIIFTIYNSYSQNNKANDTLDMYYLEDQLYFGLSYNIILNKQPINNKIVRNGLFSNGFNIGFIRDIPLNTERNLGLGVGLGFSQDNMYTNIKVNQDESGKVTSLIMETENYTSNKITLNKLDLPIEFRWRTSTSEYKDFWRIYVGGVISYVFMSYNAYQDSSIDFRYYNNNSANSFQYGISFLFGYGNWNFYGYYNLSPIYSSSFKVEDHNINLNNLNIGFRYFIL